MADPVSWLLIEPGWTVVDAAGDEIGRVEEVVGDSTADIFDGLAVASGMFDRQRYVAAEQLAEITAGQVRLALDRTAAAALPPYKEPAESAEIEPEGASHVTRAEAKLEGGTVREHDTGVVRRVLEWFGLAGKR